MIGALVDIPAPGAEGVLFALGSRFGGHALYVKDNRLHYVNSFVGSDGAEDRRLRGHPDRRGPDPVGLLREGRPGARARATGTLSLYHGDDEGRRGADQDPARRVRDRRRRPLRRPARGEPITDDYPGEPPYAFTGGTINRVAVDVSGEPYVDLEREAADACSRRSEGAG